MCELYQSAIHFDFKNLEGEVREKEEEADSRGKAGENQRNRKGGLN